MCNNAHVLSFNSRLYNNGIVHLIAPRCEPRQPTRVHAHTKTTHSKDPVNHEPFTPLNRRSQKNKIIRATNAEWIPNMEISSAKNSNLILIVGFLLFGAGATVILSTAGIFSF